MMCVFSQQYYVCLTHYLVDEIGRFLSTKIPILYNKLSKTSTTYQHIIFSISQPSKMSTDFFSGIFGASLILCMCQLSLYLLHFSHISRNIKMVVKSTLLLHVALLVSTYLYFLEGKGVVPVYHKLFKTILLTSHSLHKNFKESQDIGE